MYRTDNFPGGGFACRGTVFGCRVECVQSTKSWFMYSVLFHLSKNRKFALCLKTFYVPQEGRGIGLANKVAAYALQDGGLDTVDANRHLGFDDDLRSYEAVEHILADMGIKVRGSLSALEGLQCAALLLF